MRENKIRRMGYWRDFKCRRQQVVQEYLRRKKEQYVIQRFVCYVGVRQILKVGREEVDREEVDRRSRGKDRKLRVVMSAFKLYLQLRKQIIKRFNGETLFSKGIDQQITLCINTSFTFISHHTHLSALNTLQPLFVTLTKRAEFHTLSLKFYSSVISLQVRMRHQVNLT